MWLQLSEQLQIYCEKIANHISRFFSSEEYLNCRLNLTSMQLISIYGYTLILSANLVVFGLATGLMTQGVIRDQRPVNFFLSVVLSAVIHVGDHLPRSGSRHSAPGKM